MEKIKEYLKAQPSPIEIIRKNILPKLEGIQKNLDNHEIEEYCAEFRWDTLEIEERFGPAVSEVRPYEYNTLVSKRKGILEILGSAETQEFNFLRRFNQRFMKEIGTYAISISSHLQQHKDIFIRPVDRMFVEEGRSLKRDFFFPPAYAIFNNLGIKYTDLLKNPYRTLHLGQWEKPSNSSSDASTISIDMTLTHQGDLIEIVRISGAERLNEIYINGEMIVQASSRNCLWFPYSYIEYIVDGVKYEGHMRHRSSYWASNTVPKKEFYFIHGSEMRYGTVEQLEQFVHTLESQAECGLDFTLNGEVYTQEEVYSLVDKAVRSYCPEVVEVSGI